jgi:Mycoplasma protein of unknown function, DUF285
MIVRLSGPVWALVNTWSEKIKPDENGLAEIDRHISSIKFADAPHLIEVVEWGDFKPIYCTRMFDGCRNLVAIPKEAPDLSICESTDSMFCGAVLFNQPISHWDMSAVEYMAKMFHGAESFCQNIENWNIRSAVDTRVMFDGSGITTIPYWYDLMNRNQLKTHKIRIDGFIDALLREGVDVDHVSVCKGGLFGVKGDTRTGTAQIFVGASALSRQISVRISEWASISEKIDKFLESDASNYMHNVTNFVRGHLTTPAESYQTFREFYGTETKTHERENHVLMPTLVGTAFVETRKKL